MKFKGIVLASIFIVGLSSCGNSKKQDNADQSKTIQVNTAKELTSEEITQRFDLSQDLLVDLMMDIPSSVYMREGEGQYSILYIPKTEEVHERYKDFDKKNNVKLSEDSLGNLYYDDAAVKKINWKIRTGLDLSDFDIIGRFIPAQYLAVNPVSTKGEYVVSMPYEMYLYKLENSEWKPIESTVVMDLGGYELYESLEKYRSLLGK